MSVPRLFHPNGAPLSPSTPKDAVRYELEISQNGIIFKITMDGVETAIPMSVASCIELGTKALQASGAFPLLQAMSQQMPGSHEPA